ncbi:hypothetical protein B0H34DRAFT_674786 [Crassisporium funariophilum]|nr:hypothetical protein B0H34DRAFT_674786 [Crassisporium funariophilum]
MDFDSAWCPACDRQIQPKRYTISVPATTTLPPPPPPSSPRRTKPNLRQKPGFVNGTGRLRHNGTIKPVQPPQPQPPLKTRTVIDQGPIPLYCSDECQLADIAATRRGPPIDPAREEPSTDSSNRPNFSTAGSETESDASSAPSTSSPPPTSSIARLAAMYNFPPLPPPPPTFEDSSSSESDYIPRPYTSGVMMAGKLISSLCPPPAKVHVGPHRPPPEPRKVIPGWTDGSNAWRSTVYSFSTPQANQSPFHRDGTTSKAYGSFAATSHRANRGLNSSCTLSSAPAGPSQRSTSDDMIAKFSQSFTHSRSESRASLHQHSTATPCSPASTLSLPQSPKRERSLLQPGAEGKLLVPNVKMKVHSGSSASLSSAWSGPTSASSRRSVRSPLSVTSDSEEEAQLEAASSLPGYTKRPVVETRSWSYDNFKTYPIMQLPPKKVKKMETQIIDGEEREVEVEVEVVEERKRLFLFAPTRISR